ncbi:uncharacterized protein LOC105435800 [Cucumis sativus]|uniref:Uncharacterized protein n=1 Tax=Cucumis sativus TaxID=3659 RepID=A0A0A0KGN1_CUCSA|nr:uncharacterized protein LOC105435800 [Cucumis sativus]KGN46921.1 hypothetical protein Csa_020962 [Cucumis sativus]
MNSTPLPYRSNQVDYSRSGYYISRECSKAQMCLQKILHIISSVPRQEPRVDSTIGKLELDGNVSGGGGFRTDFNLRIGAFTVNEDQELVGFVESGGSGGGNGSVDATEKCSYGDGNGEGAKCSEPLGNETGKCDVEGHEREIPEHSKIAESSRFDENESEKTVVEEEKESNWNKLTASSVDRRDDGEGEMAPFNGPKCKSSGDCLGLLIEAARLIFGDISEDEFDTELTQEESELNNELDIKDPSQLEKVMSESHSSESKRMKLERGNWMVMNIVRDIDDRSPLVRSKRGRSQVLPCRYKDSVLEPWRSQPLPSKIKVSRRQRRSRFRT